MSTIKPNINSVIERPFTTERIIFQKNCQQTIFGKERNYGKVTKRDFLFLFDFHYSIIATLNLE
jgi:hypothetical protein